MSAAVRLPDPSAEVAIALRDLIGVPYLDRGRALDGADCFGLVRLAYQRLYDIDLPDFLGAYASAEEEAEVARAIRGGRSAWRRVSPPAPGDVVLCWYTDPAQPSHLGVYLGGRQMLSTRGGVGGARREDLGSGYWRPRVVEYLRHESLFPETFEVYLLDAKGGVARQKSFTPRTSLRAAIDAMGLGEVDEGFVRVLVGRDAYEDPTRWAHIYPRRGTAVVLRHVPGDPVTLSILLTSLATTLAAAVPGAGAVAGLVGAATFGLPIGVATAIEVGAVLAYTAVSAFTVISSITSIARGPEPADVGGIQGPDKSPTLNGAGNEIRPYQPIPEHFGDLTFFPDLAGPIWTEFIGEERWATGVYIVGEGRYEIPVDELEIGGIPLKDIEGAEVRVGEGGVFKDYAAETTSEIDPTPGATARPLAYWKMDNGTNAIAGGAAITAQSGAAFNHPLALVASGGKSGDCNGGYFLCSSLVLDWTQDWSVDLWGYSAYPGSEEVLLSIGTTNPIQIVKSAGSYGPYVQIGATKYGSLARPGGIHSDSVVQGVGHWGVGQTGNRAPRGGTSHLVVKYRRAGGLLVLQLDGIEYFLATGVSIVQPSGTARIVIGGSSATIPASRWSGRIDEVVLWQRYLDGSEVAQRTAAGEQGAGATRQPTFDVYRDTVIEVQRSERLDAADSTKSGPAANSPFVTQALNGRATQLGVDLWFDGLWRRNEIGKRRIAGAGIVLQYRPNGTDEWANAAAASGFQITAPAITDVSGDPSGFDLRNPAAFGLFGYKQDSFPVSFRWNVPEAEGFEIQIQRFETDEANNRPGGGDYGGGTTAFTVLAFKAIAPGTPPITVPGVSTFALRVPLRAVGNQLGRVQCRAKRKLAQYDPLDPDADPATGMTPERVTRNAAWAGLQVLRGDPRPCDPELINFEEIADWATRARPFDFRFDFATNKFDAFNLVAKPSRASLDIDQDGRFTVAEDRAQPVPAALFTQRNIRGFRGTKYFFDRAHALLVDWWDARGNKKQMTVYADGYSKYGEEAGKPETIGTVAASKFESIELRGLVEEDLVWEEVRIRQRATFYRDEEWRLEVPMEFLPLRRGMRAEQQHPAMLVGRKSGTVIRVNTSGSNAVSVRLDEILTFNVGESYGIRWRDAANVQHLTTVVNPATSSPIESDVVTFTTPIPTASAPAVEALVAFGLVGEETVSSMIREINPLDEWTAEVVTFPYADEIYLPGDVPVDLDPIVTPRPELPNAKAPAIPGIARIESDERWLIRAGGEVITRARVLVSAGANGLEPAAYFQLRWRLVGTGGWQNGEPFSADAGTAFADGLQDGLTYEFQARAYSANGVTSVFGAAVRHLVIGKAAPPPNITDVRVEGGHLVWSYPGLDQVVDLAGFKVRYRHGNTLPILWGRGIDAHRGLLKATVFSLDALPRDNRAMTLLLKAVDEGGNESVEPAVVVLGPGALSAQRNVTLTQQEALTGWPGEKIDCAVVSGKLEAEQTIPFAWKKRRIAGDATQVAGDFTVDPSQEVPRVALDAGPATIDDAQDGYYFWLDADGEEAFTRIAGKLSATEFLLAEPYRGAGTTGAGTIERAAYVVDERAGAWSSDPTQKAWEKRYRGLRYTATLRPDGFDLGDTIRLEVVVTPPATPYRLLYRQQGPVPAWSANPKAKAWTGDDTAKAWSGYGPWRPWPGSLTPERDVSYQFRIEFDEVRSLAPPRVDSFAIVADVPDRVENLNDVEISAEGARLYVAAPFRFIRNVYLTLQESGTPAVRVKVLDKSPAGPFVQAYDENDLPAAARIDAQLVGA